MKDLARKITAVIETRRKLLPRIVDEIEGWRRREQAVLVLERAALTLRENQATPPEVSAALGQIRATEVRQAIASVLEQLAHVGGRVSRSTLNIGVSGSARVGKSSLLQSISGLDDTELPTGSGVPVTAVRSRIYHVPGMRRAVLELHTYATFRAAYLQPRHTALGLGEAPPDIDSFRAVRYPRPGEQGYDDASHPTLLNDLREMQESLPSYAPLLEQDSRSLELSGAKLNDLRECVAYPSVEEKQAGRASRRYIAVRDVRIECEFPHAEDVGAIGVCDLPGIGEITLDADRHHVTGLRHEVDAVLLVKRAIEGMAYWGDADARAVTLLDDVRGFVSRRRDFVFVVLNTGSASAALVENLRDDVRRKLNEGEEGLHHQVLEVDAKSGRDVETRVLRPVLEHLITRLPAMDAEILAVTQAQSAAARDMVASLANDFKSTLRQVRAMATGVAETLHERADDLHKDLAVALHALLDELAERASGPDPDYAKAVEDVYDGALSWVRDGLGMGREAWCARALPTMIRDGGGSRFATDELNRVRVELSRMFGNLDLFFEARVEETWRQVAHGLAGELSGLLDGRSGQQALQRLAVLAAEATEPCEAMRQSIGELLELRLDYRTHLHPRVRPELDGLSLQVLDPASGHDVVQVVVPTTQDGAEELYELVSELAEQAAFRIRTALLREAMLPGQVLFAVVEHFDDSLIRSGAAMREFRQLARSYGNELWPGALTGLYEADAGVSRVRRAADDLLATIAHGEVHPA